MCGSEGFDAQAAAGTRGAVFKGAGPEPIAMRTLIVRALLIVVGAAPLLHVASQSWNWHDLGAALDTWFNWQCHRKIGRELWLGATASPVCARCFGLYVGLLAAGAYAVVRGVRARILYLMVAGALAVMALDMVTEAMRLHPSWPWVRFATGVALAYPVGLAAVTCSRANRKRLRPQAKE